MGEGRGGFTRDCNYPKILQSLALNYTIMRYSILICFLVAINTTLHSQSNSSGNDDWLFVARTPAKDSIFIASSYVKKYSDIITDNTIIKIWTKRKDAKVTLNKKVYYNVTAKILMEFDCTDKKIKSLRIVYYNSTNKLLDDYEFSFPDWSDVIPETMGETLLAKVCLLFGNE